MSIHESLDRYMASCQLRYHIYIYINTHRFLPQYPRSIIETEYTFPFFFRENHNFHILVTFVFDEISGTIFIIIFRKQSFLPYLLQKNFHLVDNMHIINLVNKC